MSPETAATCEINRAAVACKRVARELAILSTQSKNQVLESLGHQLQRDKSKVLVANRQDLERAKLDGLASAKLERLMLTAESLDTVAEGVLQVAALPDPVGQVISERTVPSGLRVKKVRCSLGVILMIYESRPNVTIDAFALCFKSGNVAVLKGGREARHSNAALGKIVDEVLQKHGVASRALTLLANGNRDDLREWLRQSDSIDLVIPRGGASLIEFVRQHSQIPTVQHFHGICHIFVDEEADLHKSLRVCVTAKTSAPATCNAVETILVHERIADVFIPMLVHGYVEQGVAVRGDERVMQVVATANSLPVTLATEGDWSTEYLARVVSVKCVANLQSAVAHIGRYGSNHTEAIMSENMEKQREFCQNVQSSCVLVNASTRFNDGMQLGLGAEIGISTSRIHAYGPMGLEELTVARYIVHGDGQFR